MELRTNIINIYGNHITWFDKTKEVIEFKDESGEWKPLPEVRTNYRLSDFR